MTEKDDHPAASHFRFPYYFANKEGDPPIVAGINFRGIRRYEGDLLIYYGSLSGSSYIDSWCTRWDQTDWGIVVETFMNESELRVLLNNITPGAVGELYEVLGSKVYYDQTWNSDNTIKFVPNRFTKRVVGESAEGENVSNIAYMREEILVYVKNITTSDIEGSSGLINVKIDAVKSGSRI